MLVILREGSVRRSLYRARLLRKPSEAEGKHWEYCRVKKSICRGLGNWKNISLFISLCLKYNLYT